MAGVYVPILAAGVSGVVLLAVAFWGAWFGRRSEHAKWVRDQRVQVCSEWLGVLEELLIYMEDLRVLTAELEEEIAAFEDVTAEFRVLVRTPLEGLTAPVLEELVGSRERSERKLERLTLERGKLTARHDELTKDYRRLRLTQASVSNRLQILGSELVRDEAKVLLGLMNEVIGVVRDGSSPDPNQGADWEAGLRRFHRVVRKELGLK
jgi:hypothetical protein